MKILSLILLLTIVATLGCSESKTVGSSSAPEAFEGTYRVKDKGLVGEKADSVLITIEGNRSYRLTHFSDIGDGREFCGSRGIVGGFGSPRVTLTPSDIFTGMCDSLRLPLGTFEAVFHTNDSLTLTRETSDSIYVMILSR